MTATAPKTGMKAIAEGKTDLFRIAPEHIVVKEGWNSRDFDHPENKAHVRALADSIKEVGVKEPLSGYLEDGKFVLTNGESRYRAVILCLSEGVEIKNVPVMTEPRHASEADHLASQIIRNSGRPFTPLENAKLFAKLFDLGWTAKDIASKTGMTSERVNQIAKLNTVTAKVRKEINAGTISPTTVQRIQAKAKDSKEVEAQVSAAIADAKAQGRAKATPRNIGGGKKTAKTPAAARVNYKDLFETLMSCVDSVDAEDGEKTLVQVSMTPDAWAKMEAAYKGSRPAAEPEETF